MGTSYGRVIGRQSRGHEFALTKLGTTIRAIQSGADTVIDFGAGNQMILFGVSMSPLTGNWIFVAQDTATGAAHPAPAAFIERC